MNPLSLSSKYRTHTCGELNASNVGANVTLSGWVHRKRDHGQLLFVDLRDNYGITQCVFDLNDAALAGFEKIRPESCVQIRGTVVAREGSQTNDKIPTGAIEIKVNGFDIWTESNPLPFQVFGDEDAPEDTRYTYRYLDLRRENLHKNILMRNKINRWFRDRMWDLGFSEFQTPILTASSPEGARDFLVPSRLHHGKFYALPQAPQQFKQLLMISGFDRYFQLAPVFRDEDLRADRLIEYYQLDLEMSFVEQSDIQAVGDTLLPAVIREFRPNAKIHPDIPHIPFDVAMLKYGSDKPDLRNPIEIADVSEIFRASDFGIFSDAVARGEVVRAVPAPNSGDKPRSWFDKMTDFATKELGLGGLAYIIFADNDPSAQSTAEAGVKGPVAKKLKSEEIEKLRKHTNGANTTLFFVAGDAESAAKAAGKLRNRLGAELGLIDPDEYRLCWVEDFPFFEKNDEAPNGISFGHNPFSRPQGDLENLDLSDPLKLKAYQFDMVLNGSEICSGGLRNYNPRVMLQLFAIIGMNEEEVKDKFGGMYNAFQYGAPPHGGCAFGTERIICELNNEESMRECVAFPINQRGMDLMLGAPREASEQQLRDVHIQIRKKG